MAKKVIQVPIDEQLLNSPNSMAKKRGQPRSELIREACQRYLKQAEYDKMALVNRAIFASDLDKEE